MKYDLPKDGGMFYGYGDKYTVSVHNLRVNGFDFGLDRYPIWDENFRDSFNLMLLDYFDSYEIGCETPEAWKRLLNAKLSLIMPRYNVMFKSRNLTIDPLLDHDFYKIHDEVGTLDTTQNNTNNKISKTTTAEDQTKDNTSTVDKDVDDTNSRDIGLVHGEVTTDTLNSTETESSTKTIGQVYSEATHEEGEDKKEHADYTDDIIRNSDTPQQSIENLGYAPDPAPGINDPVIDEHGTLDLDGSTLFNPSWVDKWLSNASKKDSYNRGIETGEYSKDGTKNSTTNTTENFNGTKTKGENKRGTDDYTDKTDDDYTGHTDDVTNTIANEVIDKDTVQDYSHTDKLDAITDTDTTTYYQDHDYGRNASQQELAAKLYETAYDIEMLIIKDLSPLFLSLYY